MDDPPDAEEPAAGVDEPVTVTVDGTVHRLSRAAARRLRAALGEALAGRREFLHTVGEERPDGRYEVARRRADSPGNAVVFEGVDALVERYEALPREFTATDLGERVTGSRRHLLVRHFAEHPEFACSLVRRNPLTVRKEGD